MTPREEKRVVNARKLDVRPEVASTWVGLKLASASVSKVEVGTLGRLAQREEADTLGRSAQLPLSFLNLFFPWPVSGELYNMEIIR